MLYARDPIALHCPVNELAPVPGLPIFPVINAIFIIACAVLTASYPWLTPIVHQIDTLSPLLISSTNSKILSASIPVASTAFSIVYFLTNSLNSSNPSVYFSIYS